MGRYSRGEPGGSGRLDSVHTHLTTGVTLMSSCDWLTCLSNAQVAVSWIFYTWSLFPKHWPGTECLVNCHLGEESQQACQTGLNKARLVLDGVKLDTFWTVSVYLGRTFLLRLAPNKVNNKKGF